MAHAASEMMSQRALRGAFANVKVRDARRGRVGEWAGGRARARSDAWIGLRWMLMRLIIRARMRSDGVRTARARTRRVVVVDGSRARGVDRAEAWTTTVMTARGPDRMMMVEWFFFCNYWTRD